MTKRDRAGRPTPAANYTDLVEKADEPCMEPLSVQRVCGETRGHTGPHGRGFAPRNVAYWVPPENEAQDALEVERSALGSANCWCGRERGHDWLGKDQRAPHPRAAS